VPENIECYPFFPVLILTSATEDLPTKAANATSTGKANGKGIQNIANQKSMLAVFFAAVQNTRVSQKNSRKRAAAEMV
jgi:hypothetical protein